MLRKGRLQEAPRRVKATPHGQSTRSEVSLCSASSLESRRSHRSSYVCVVFVLRRVRRAPGRISEPSTAHPTCSKRETPCPASASWVCWSPPWPRWSSDHAGMAPVVLVTGVCSRFCPACGRVWPCRTLLPDEPVEPSVSVPLAASLPFLASFILLFLYYYFVSMEILVLVYTSAVSLVCIGADAGGAWDHSIVSSLFTRALPLPAQACARTRSYGRGALPARRPTRS